MLVISPKNSIQFKKIKMSNFTIIEYVDYTNEEMIADIKQLVSKDLSEPYSIFTYRFFLHNWPKLCICVYAIKSSGEREMIGTLVCKAELENNIMTGYVAMLAVNKEYRKQGIGSTLVEKGIDRMIEMGCEEIMLEAEVIFVLFIIIQIV